MQPQRITLFNMNERICIFDDFKMNMNIQALSFGFWFVFTSNVLAGKLAVNIILYNDEQ